MAALEQSAGATRLDVDNKSNFWEFLWIGIYSTLLLFPTLTIFRFWARTIIRRRIWGDTTIGGEPLEYTGKGSELFFGFLISFCIFILPLSLVIVAVQMFLGREALVIATPAIYLVLFVLLGAALFLARRYQLSRTQWRGVRFEQRGSALGYGFMVLGYTLLTAITLGWFGPAMRLRMEKHLWKNAYFGDMQFTYDNSPAARTQPVYVSYILAFVGVLALYVALIGTMIQFYVRGGPAAIGVQEILIIYAILFGGGFVLIFFVAWHEAVMIRQIAQSLSLGNISLSSRFSAWDVIELAITNTLLIVFTLGLGVVAAQMRVWRRVCKRLEVEGTLDAARIQQAAAAPPRTGEGLADAFDLSGGI